MVVKYKGALPENDGFLWVDSNDDLLEMGNPKYDGTDVAKAVKKTMTKWSSKSSEKLFKKKTLDISDISQERVGDCWYLAALAAIVNHRYGSSLIKKTMVDCGDGNAVVRLYGGDYLPNYIKMEKSVLWSSGRGKVHARQMDGSGIWPLMLEKAATCMKKDTDWKECDHENPHYKNIIGGGSHEAFRMLLGVKTSKHSCGNRNGIGRNGSQSKLSLLFATGNWNIGPGQEERAALQEVFGGQVSVQQWKLQLKQLKLKRSPLVISTIGVTVGSAGWSNNFLQLMNSPNLSHLPSNISTALANYAKNNEMINGKLGSGIYTAGAQALFNQIAGNVAAHRPMCLGTKQNIGPVTGRGHSAGEDESHGMVGNHAYAILDTFAETAGPKRKYVKIANPWGRFGRSYVEQGNLSLKPQEQKSGVFWLELSDFCHVVDNLYTCDSDPGDLLSFN